MPSTDIDPSRRVRAIRSTRDWSSLFDVAEAVSIATEDESQVYVERLGSLYRWSLVHRGGGLTDLFDKSSVFEAVFDPGRPDVPLVGVSPFGDVLVIAVPDDFPVRKRRVGTGAKQHPAGFPVEQNADRLDAANPASFSARSNPALAVGGATLSSGVTLDAGSWVKAPNNLSYSFLNSTGQVYLDTGAVIDVSGS